MRKGALALAVLLALAGCAKKPAAPAPAAAATPAPAAGFVNRVWTVKESLSVEPGMFYVFLSDGTLVMSSSHGTPAFGKWTRADGKLTMIEEGIAYPVDILTLTADEFRIRSHNPAGAVEILLVPAPSE